MPFSIVDQTKLEARLSADVVRRITDDANTGVANTAPVDQILSDGQARVMGYVRRAYTPAQIALILAMNPLPELLVSLCLDACQLFAFERFPSYCRIQPTMPERLQRELELVATSRLRFDGADGATTDPVPQNVGGLSAKGPSSPSGRCRTPTFSNGMGDF